jgi:hypothetical protein
MVVAFDFLVWGHLRPIISTTPEVGFEVGFER